jgi:hypothetical protein
MQVSVPGSNVRVGASRLRLAGAMAGAVMAGALILGACGSSTPSGTATTAAGGGTTATTAGGGTTATTAGGGTTATTVAGGGISSIAAALQSGENTTFDATYTVSGGTSGMSSFEYAVSPPSNFAAKVNTSNGLSDIISNGTNSYACSQKSGAWTCIQFPAADGAAYEDAYLAFTGKYWYTYVAELKTYSSIAGFKETTSTMSAAGQTLNCITWSGGPAGADGAGEVCVTSAGVLGYVHSDADNTTMSLTSYSTSVPSGTFQTPAGATVQTIPGGL